MNFSNKHTFTSSKHGYVFISSLVTLALFSGTLCSCQKQYNIEEFPEQQSDTLKPSPELNVSPRLFHFFTSPRENPPDETIQLYSRFEPVYWTLSSNATWLTISRTKGISRSLAEEKKTEVTLHIDSSSLEGGTYSTILVFTSKQLIHDISIPVNLYVTTAKAGQSPDINVILCPDIELAEGYEITDQASLTQAEVKYEILTRTASRDWPVMYRFYQNDLCLLITGTIKNETNQNLVVNLRATGYNKYEKETAWSLQVDPYHFRIGNTSVELSKYSSANFSLYLGWSEDIDTIKIFASKRVESEIPPP